MLAQIKTAVNQGDAMGPLGFDLGLDGALEKCAEDETSVEWPTWYLDYSTIISSPEAAGNYLAGLIPALKDVGPR